MMNKTDNNIYVDIDQLRKLQFKGEGINFSPRQAVNSVLNGRYASKLRGRGLNFEELRHYRAGDDIRYMDWKVTKRTGKPHIKVFTEERERNVFLIVDQRASMFFGSKGKMKSVIGAELAALIGWRVVAAGDRIGALIFNDDNETVLPAKRGHKHLAQILHSVVKFNHQLGLGNNSHNASDSINKGWRKIAQVCGHDSLIIYVGDGNGWNEKTTHLMKNIRRHNEVIACNIIDALEQKLPSMAQMVVSDGELQIQFDALGKTQQQYQQRIESQQTLYAKTATKYRVPLLTINTIKPVNIQLRNAFRRGGE
ncbi:DUF58 domain-containing protein [Shewanella sp. KT0246]|uniref:DUF58 domain-containing protein n=1 Tax=Shewanella sp. KT0246 TaxID=2815912 RepID=UPI001C7D3FC1|nr:DUF58 domain-containing protein [Shewanella sp. KT0246]